MGEKRHPQDERKTVIVVGGGIAGLYGARLLAKKGYKVILFERRERLGGRIETADLRGFSSPDSQARQPSFKAEFGPMRFELAIQPLMKKLGEDLGIGFNKFEPPKAAVSPSRYRLEPDERDPQNQPLDSLQLLRLGVFRMFDQKTRFDSKTECIVLKRPSWLKNLGDDVKKSGFEDLRENAIHPKTGTKLHNMGFWNALAEVLSPEAVRKIESQGTFYHLLPENPNAVEWGIFWLRLFKLKHGGKLDGIPGGVRQLTEGLEAEFRTRYRGLIEIRLQHEVVELSPRKSGGVDVHAINHQRDTEEKDVEVTEAAHVLLAAPKAALERLADAFPEEIRNDLDTVVGFRLLKAFLCMRRPSWWASKLPLAQTGAWNVPTRELHYYEDSSKHNAMMLLYADEPTASYWAPYIEDPSKHDRAQVGGPVALKRELVKLLLERQREATVKRATPGIGHGSNAAQAVAILYETWKQIPELKEEPRKNQVFRELPPDIDKALVDPKAFGSALWDSVSDYAIRDWLQQPDGGGSHAWKPHARSWEVRRRLRGFAIRSDSTISSSEPLHICGEAYSDYQGFIEGALRSTADAVAVIDGKRPQHSS